MNEATEVIQLAAPYIAYVLPAVLIFSSIAVGEYFSDFIIGLFEMRKKKRARYT